MIVNTKVKSAYLPCKICFFQAHNYIICMSINFDETENSHFPFSGSVIWLHVNVDGLRVTCNHVLIYIL